MLGIEPRRENEAIHEASSEVSGTRESGDFNFGNIGDVHPIWVPAAAKHKVAKKKRNMFNIKCVNMYKTYIYSIEIQLKTRLVVR